MAEKCNDSSWKKIVIAKTNNAWTSKIRSGKRRVKTISNVKTEDMGDGTSSEEDNKRISPVVNKEPVVQDLDSLLIESRKNTKKKRRRRKRITLQSETRDERIARLAKMSAYASNRLANETPEQRAERLKRMSKYAAKRISQETTEQRARRLARMSAYAAKRLAEETPKQREARLARMSAYAGRKLSRKKISSNS